LIIDATRQLPEEGGPDVFPIRNRVLFDELAPDAASKAQEKWGDMINGWGKTRY
jgi:hypothetical protein